MSLILHLTDLHLGVGGADTPTGDAKVSVVPAAEMETRLSSVQDTMHDLVEAMGARRFSAVVISGDVTQGNSLEGFSKLKGFLANLSEVLPEDPKAIVVVPGNHDVSWGTKPSTPDRYRNFCDIIRADLNATTPFLEGVDSNPSGSSPCWISEAESLAIVAINSSNYCGVNASLKVDAEAFAKFKDAMSATGEDRKIMSAIEGSLQFDMARISPDQFKALRAASKKAFQDLVDPIVIGVVHHQLLPVSTDEEIKPFESFTNLGKFRKALRDAKVAVLLHGHKHKSRIYWDQDPPEADILAMSGASVGGAGWDQDEPFRIIEIMRRYGSHEVRTFSPQQFINKTDVPLTGIRRKMSWDRPAVDPDALVSINAADFDEAYAKVCGLPLFRKGGPGTMHNVSIRVAQAKTVGAAAPKYYPKEVVRDSSDLNAWFEEVARWWQRENSELPRDIYFTHGFRIRSYDGFIDQVKRAYKTLDSGDIGNGRAIITLTDPESDFRDEPKKPSGWFPAFCMAQLYLTQDTGGRKHLNVVGFFRKQEMRYWWPINMRELRMIQDAVIALGLRAKIGSITTVATIAVVEDERPRVAIPLMDRWYDGDKRRIADLIHGFSIATTLSADTRLEKLNRWADVLSDLVPPEAHNVAALGNTPLTTRGIELAGQLLETFVANGLTEGVPELRDEMINVQEHLTSIRRLLKGKRDEVTLSNYESMREKIRGRTERIRVLTESTFS